MRQLTDVEKRRLQNVRTLAHRYPNNKELGAALGLTKSGISQLIGHTPARPISERAARRWEQRLKLPEGTLDQQPQHPSPALDAVMPRLVGPTVVQQPDGAQITMLDQIMRDVDAAAVRAHGNISHEKYRALVTYLYRQGMRHGYQVDQADVDSLVRLVI